MTRRSLGSVSIALAGALTLSCSGSERSGAPNDSSQAGRPPAGTGGGGRSAAASGSSSSSSGHGAGSAGGQGAGTGGDGRGAGTSASLPSAGNPNGHCTIPAAAALEDVSHPTTVVGDGTSASCTADAFVNAVADGGIITFACGPDPVTITLRETAKVWNDKSTKVVIDGGGKVTLSGGDKVRILYQNTCDQALHYTTSHCDNQDSPQLTVQNLTFVHGAAAGLSPDGGGAIFARGGRLKIINSRFFNNSCDSTGPDVGGAAVRAFDQYDDQPLYVVNSTFGGSAELGNVCSNGGGLSSIGVSYSVINSLFSYNRAIGRGANPARSGTPGGGSGGAIYNDGNTFTLSLCGTSIEHNSAVEGGGAIFFVSNDHSGSLVIDSSTLRDNPNDGFATAGYPGIFVLDTDDKPTVTGSTTIE